MGKERGRGALRGVAFSLNSRQVGKQHAVPRAFRFEPALVGTPTFVIDETLERRWGPRLKKRGHYRRDALASSRQCAVTTSGLRWIVLALVIATLESPLPSPARPRIRSGADYSRKPCPSGLRDAASFDGSGALPSVGG